MASAFSETAKLAKRVRELEDVDAELEAYRQVQPTISSTQLTRYQQPCGMQPKQRNRSKAQTDLL